METLKSLADIPQPDSRNLIKVFINKTTRAQRRNSLQDMHADVACLHLGEAVPTEIRSQFGVAQNLAVYAWYCYPFHMSAQLQAFACIEFALRLRLKPTTRQDGHFKTMLRKAVSVGLLKDSGFRFFPVEQSQKARTIFSKGKTKVVTSHVEVLIETLPDLRNNLAHGATTLWDGAAGMLRLAADIINQLFAASPSKADGAS